jgi:hypothetical protein
MSDQDRNIGKELDQYAAKVMIFSILANSNHPVIVVFRLIMLFFCIIALIALYRAGVLQLYFDALYGIAASLVVHVLWPLIVYAFTGS